jgi:alanyl-tRNA synthetase
MTSAQIRQSFLDFFREKSHSVVPSSSLMPDSPNLLFTNAGMNQFVPIFLGQRAPDVSRWAGAVPGSDTRAADTQKCIRAGGKHNDLDDVGLDTYHHTFFEMLGNWSFGDYFKAEAIAWAWELVVERWKFPPQRLYATIYNPEPGDPAERDTEAWELWAEKFRAAGLDPDVHIVNGNKKDNFWMMGETGPCGPCSELHVDLTPAGDTRGALVNRGTAECIEIWNLVFIQFNANPDGSFSPLPAKHVDTGMGFERVCSIIQGTKGFSDFSNARISNYETDVFRPIFDEIEKLSGQQYTSTLPDSPTAAAHPRFAKDIAFRVIADHIRTLAFAVADGIQPGNTDRNYVLRRILRRAVRYGRTLGFREPFFYRLVDVLARTMGGVFPELRAKQKHIEEVLRREEEAFNKTLDKGIALFEAEAGRKGAPQDAKPGTLEACAPEEKMCAPDEACAPGEKGMISGAFAFRLYDEQGFPLDLTELMARERGLAVDVEGFEELMNAQRTRARAAQKKQVISLSEIETVAPTRFEGYDNLSVSAKVLEVVLLKDRTAVILDSSPCYAEMGGQVGDTGELDAGGRLWRISNTQKSGQTWLHVLDSGDAPDVGSVVGVSVDAARRAAIQRHHTVTHLLHWALHEVVSHEATQKGSSVGPDKLTFDFNSAPLTAVQIRDIERLVNGRIVANVPVTWTEVAYADVRGRADIMQFFGDKYGESVRVVQVGGSAGLLDGYSMELCAGTHARATGEIGLFRILGEAAIAAGVRRIEAVAGLEAASHAERDAERIAAIAAQMNCPVAEIEKKIEGLLAHQKELEKSLKSARAREASARARELVASAESVGGIPFLAADLGPVDGDFVQSVADALKGSFDGVCLLAGTANGAVALVATVSAGFTARVQAGKLIQAAAPIVGGKGGGKPDAARGGGKDASKVAAALAHARALLA